MCSSSQVTGLPSRAIKREFNVDMCVLIFARVSGPVFVLGARMQIYDHLPDCIDALKMGPALWRGSEEALRRLIDTSSGLKYAVFFIVVVCGSTVNQNSAKAYGVYNPVPACQSLIKTVAYVMEVAFSSWKRCCHSITWRGSTSLSGPSTHISPQVARVKPEWESSKTNLEYIPNVTDNKSQIPSRWILSVH